MGASSKGNAPQALAASEDVTAAFARTSASWVTIEEHRRCWTTFIVPAAVCYGIHPFTGVTPNDWKAVPLKLISSESASYSRCRDLVDCVVSRSLVGSAGRHAQKESLSFAPFVNLRTR